MINAAERINTAALEALKGVLGEEFPGLLADFRRSSAENLQELSSAYQAQDRVRIKSIAHSLKGSALNLYAPPLANCCAQLENMALSSELRQLEVTIAVLCTEVDDTLQAIEHWLLNR